RHRARPPHRCRRGRRFPVAPGHRPRAGDRFPGVHHRGRQSQGPAVDRRDPAVHQLWRIVAARQCPRHRTPARTVRQGRRTASATPRDVALPTHRPTGGCLMHGTGTARRPLGRQTVHVLVVISIAFALLAAAVGDWGIVEAPDLVRSPTDAAVIAAARTVPRGLIKDSTGKVLADNKKDKNGESYRVYAGRQISQVVGYASTTYGRGGLERTYDAALAGPAA